MKTTRELAREESHKQLVQSLQELLVKNYDAVKGFKKAIKEAKNPDLKEYLKIQAFRHQRYTNELDKVIHSLNETPFEEGSAAGKFHRVWMDIINSITGNNDETILSECNRGQKASLREYEEKLKKYKFPQEIFHMLKQQQQELEATLDEVKTLKDLT